MDYEIIDADRHVIEPEDLWADILPKKIYQQCQFELIEDNASALVDRIKRFGSDGAVYLPREQRLKGKPLLKNWNEALRLESSKAWQQCVPSVKQAMHPKSQIDSMNTSGISRANLFPTYASFVVNNAFLSAEESNSIASSYNKWLKDYCDSDPLRLNAVGIISRHTPNSMVDQLQQIIDYGWQCVTLRPEPILGHTLGSKAYETFWSACENANIAIAIHGSTHLQGDTVGYGRFSSRFSLHACSHLMEAQMAFLSLLESGVLESHPHLKVGFFEAGASWIPSWLWRLDEVCYASLPNELKNAIKMKPSEYFKRQCWIGFEMEEPGLRDVADCIGIDRLLFGTDFPHPDHEHLNEMDFETKCDFSEQELKVILEQNPKRFFGC